MTLSIVYLSILVCVSVEKPALDPNAAKMWTLSANDMNDDDVVSVSVCVYVWPLAFDSDKITTCG